MPRPVLSPAERGSKRGEDRLEDRDPVDGAGRGCEAVDRIVGDCDGHGSSFQLGVK